MEYMDAMVETTATTSTTLVVLDDLDRPVTMREFNELIKRFDKLDEERAKEKQERDEEKQKAANERAKAQKEWENGNVVEWLRMYFKIHKGDDDDLLTIHRLKKEE